MDLIESLVQYVKDIKPYHTKIYGVDVEYRAFEDLNVSISEDFQIQVFLGSPFRADLHDFSWDYKDLITPDFDSLGEAVFGDIFDITQGWDSNKYDISLWDEDTIQFAPNFRSKNFLMDTVVVQFTEQLKIDIDRVTIDVADCVPIVHNIWDPVINGIQIQKTVNNTIIISGNHVNILNDLSTIEIIDCIDNGGIYGILNTTYDPARNLTIITVSSILTDTAYDGKLKVGLWDSNYWDGDPTYFVSHPEADAYARAQFTESLRITEGYGWDDPILGGWDNNNTHTWDDAVLWIDHQSSAIVYDVNNPCIDNEPNINPVTAINDALGIVVFSPEHPHAPEPLDNYPTIYKRKLLNINWVSVNVPLANYEAVCYSPELNRFVAVTTTAVSGGFAAVSNTGYSWTFHPTPSMGVGLRDVCWSPELGIFCAVGSTFTDTQGIMTSHDGVTWIMRSVPSSSPFPNYFTSVVWSSELQLFVAISDLAVFGTPTEMATRNYIVSSPDGITWTRRYHPYTITPDINPIGMVRPVDLVWVKYLNKFVIIGDYGTTIQSSDGINWQLVAAPPLTTISQGLVVSNDHTKILRAIPANGHPLYWTTDGVDWEPTDNNLPFGTVITGIEIDGLEAICYVSNNGGIWFSQDLENWTLTTTLGTSSNSFMTDICWASGQQKLIVTKYNGTNRILIGTLIVE